MKFRVLQKNIFIIFFSCTITRRTCSITHRLKNVSGNTPNQSCFMHETDTIDSPVTHSQNNFYKGPQHFKFGNISLQQEVRCIIVRASRGGFWNICFCEWGCSSTQALPLGKTLFYPHKIFTPTWSLQNVVLATQTPPAVGILTPLSQFEKLWV